MQTQEHTMMESSSIVVWVTCSPRLPGFWRVSILSTFDIPLLITHPFRTPAGHHPGRRTLWRPWRIPIDGINRQDCKLTPLEEHYFPGLYNLGISASRFICPCLSRYLMFLPLASSPSKSVLSSCERCLAPEGRMQMNTSLSSNMKLQRAENMFFRN